MKKVLLILLILLAPAAASAHSGRTNSSGCHNQTSNGTYHCHNSGSDSSSSVAPAPTKSYQSVSSELGVSYCSVYAYTREEVTNFITIYEEELLRVPTCDELKFQVEHVTPHDTLRSYLQSVPEYEAARYVEEEPEPEAEVVVVQTEPSVEGIVKKANRIGKRAKIKVYKPNGKYLKSVKANRKGKFSIDGLKGEKEYKFVVKFKKNRKVFYKQFDWNSENSIKFQL